MNAAARTVKSPKLNVMILLIIFLLLCVFREKMLRFSVENLLQPEPLDAVEDA